MYVIITICLVIRKLQRVEKICIMLNPMSVIVDLDVACMFLRSEKYLGAFEPV